MVQTKQYEKQRRKRVGYFWCCRKNMLAYTPFVEEDYNQTCKACEKRKKEKEHDEKEEKERWERYWNERRTDTEDTFDYVGYFNMSEEEILNLAK
jgi:hypothetical protein